jgi:sec-independent protein translocase protein TatA
MIILFIILLLFGAKRMPDMARSLGRSVRILKAETKNDGTKTDEQPKNPEA